MSSPLFNQAKDIGESYSYTQSVWDGVKGIIPGVTKSYPSSEQTLIERVSRVSTGSLTVYLFRNSGNTGLMFLSTVATALGPTEIMKGLIATPYKICKGFQNLMDWRCVA